MRIQAKFIVTLLLSAWLLAACSSGEAQLAAAMPAATPLPVEVVAPQYGDIFASHHSTTTLESDAEAAIPARVPGVLVRILAEEGDRVRAGQILAHIDGERLKLETQHAKASLEQAKREYERNIRLHERGLVSAATFDGMKYALDELQAAYELKKLELAYTAIRAPVSGVVTARAVKPGNHVEAGELTFRVSDTARLVAYLQIPQNELSRISLGQDIALLVDALPGKTFAAAIDRISPTVDPRNGTFRATAYIDNAEGMLAPGMFGRFNIAYDRHSDVLTIPAGAVIEEDTVSVVYVVADGLAERRPIRIGIRDEQRIEVLEGLGPHEQVVITGQGSLRDGSLVYASAALPAATAG